ncbi:sensor histidine kinase [Brachybacterium sp.]|uniref:sensor histidine kinase n=1 Tax=Brachybacterium sp. TaxID=1891286 RepID=UPI002ED27328
MAEPPPPPPPAGGARLEARLADAALAVSVTLVIALVISIDPAAGSPWLGLACAAVFGTLLLARRRFPVSVLVVTILAVFVYYAAGFPPIGMVLPAVGALYSAAELRRTPWAIGCAAVLIAVSLYFRLDETDPQAALNGFTVVTELALAAAALALGVAVRQGREARERSARIAELTAAEEALAAEARMQAERVRIARDLHDTIGHTLSVASLHAAVAGEATEEASQRAALTEVRTATSDALRELRRTVKVLRDEPPVGPEPALGLASLDRVFEAARAAGLQVQDEIAVETDALPRAVDAAAFRIVQESVTNVLRHADASTVRVRAALREDVLTLRISDDGRGTDGHAPPVTRSGAGLRGMQERAALQGGTLTAGPLTTGPGREGFLVEARLPAHLEEDS